MVKNAPVERRQLITTGLSPLFVELLKQHLEKRFPGSRFERSSGELWVTGSKSAHRKAVDAFISYRAGYVDGRENRG